nr:putative T6SS immunity periplasmic lipoprotein [Winslowiella iniecta]
MAMPEVEKFHPFIKKRYPISWKIGERMMKSSILLLLVFILAGCESADPRPKIFPANVFTLNDHVCVLVPAAEGEFLLSVEINGTGSEERLRKVFIHNKPIYLSSQRCVPLFGYQFESGRAYGVSVQAVTQENQQNNTAGRIYTVSFSLWKDQSNKLQVAIQ